MKWKSTTKDGEKTLYLQENNGKWMHYNASKYALSDCDAKHSKGWATFQRLHKLGWELVQSD